MLYMAFLHFGSHLLETKVPIFDSIIPPAQHPLPIIPQPVHAGIINWVVRGGRDLAWLECATLR